MYAKRGFPACRVGTQDRRVDGRRRDAEVEAVGEQKIATDTWVHLAATLDNDQLALYVDGTLVSKMAIDPARTIGVRPNPELFIGFDPKQLEDPFSGAIDEVLILNKALSPEEILRLASGTPAKSKKP